MAARISSIRIYPVKSLDPLTCMSVSVSDSGSMSGDRRYAIIDREGRLINGKREPKLHRIRSEFTADNRRIRFQGSDWRDLENERFEIGVELTALLGYPVELQKTTDGSGLDDPAGSHLTVVSTASLERVAEWFDMKDLEEARLRFRANIEVEGVPAFWEDRLFLPGKQPVSFTIGEVDAYGRKPCPRCPVPARNPFTGLTDTGFQKQFEMSRREHLPRWSTLDTYGHGYFLSTSAVVLSGQAGKMIRCGDEITLK